MFKDNKLIFGQTNRALFEKGFDVQMFDNDNVGVPMLPNYPSFIREFMFKNSLIWKWQFNKENLNELDPELMTLKEFFFEITEAMLYFNKNYADDLKN